jgi:phage regulator Rha-like protein
MLHSATQNSINSFNDKGGILVSIIPVEKIEQKIFFIRKQKVMLDSDLATLYGVSTKRLNEQLRRNLKRFPEDFMFQLSKDEYESLRSQIATLKTGRGRHRKYSPYVFTEHGAIMLATILNSAVAIQASIQVVRAFVRLREFLAANKELARKLKNLEKKIDTQDEKIYTIFEALKQLMQPTQKQKGKIGFKRDQEKE